MPALARVGDPTSHGGVIIAGSPRIVSYESPVARQGDLVSCPEHGNNPIVTGSSRVFIDGRSAAREGDMSSCGSVISGGDFRVQIL